jgi:MFS family permease
VLGLFAVLVVALQPFASRLLGRFDRPAVLAAASALVGAGFGLYAFVDAAPLYALGVAVWTLGEILQAPVAPSVMADLAPSDGRGAYQGAYYLTWQLAAFLGPLLAGAVIAGPGPRALWGGCLLVGLLAALGYAAFSGELRRQLEARLG